MKDGNSDTVAFFSEEQMLRMYVRARPHIHVHACSVDVSPSPNSYFSLARPGTRWGKPGATARR
jgi:hypothetical protein